MNICLIMDNPETSHHPVIAVALQQLSVKHTVRLLDVRTLTADEALAQENTHTRADLYLLKSHAPQALDIAHVLEQQGTIVINSWASSRACQDRVSMTQHMVEAHLPWPQTQSFDTLESLLSQPDRLASLVYPLILKSRYSHRGDLVEKIQSKEQLQQLTAEWSQEPVILQALVESDGWDIKVWVIDQHIYAARRRTPLEANASKKDFPLTTSDMPEQLSHIIREIGRVFHLHLYGVDLLMTEQGPMVVDINSFPGFRGVPDADTALVNLVERLLLQAQKLH